MSLSTKLVHSLLRFGVSAQPSCRRGPELSGSENAGGAAGQETQPLEVVTRGAELALCTQRVLHSLVDRRGNLDKALALRIFETRDALEQSGAHATRPTLLSFCASLPATIFL